MVESTFDGMTGIVTEIYRERESQDRKFGESNHTDFEFLAILMEEVGEVAQAVVQTQWGGPHAGTTRAELIHAIAVGVSFVQCIDRREKTSLSVPQPEPEIGQVDK